MNQFGSYRALLGNAISALSAAIEIYNKPRIEYRDECTVILLVNAWELLLKAILSKNKARIYYPKKRNEPYRTYALSDCLNKASPYFKSVQFDGTAANLQLLSEYRDNAVHFYNKPGFSVIIYSLAQTAIVNFRDLAEAALNVDIAGGVNLALLPLALGTSLDPIKFLTRDTEDSATSRSVQEFSVRLKELVRSVEDGGGDTGRLFTTLSTHLISTKKITKADLVVGVQAMAEPNQQMLVQHNMNPNNTHKYRATDIVTNAKGEGLKILIGGQPLSQYKFQAITHLLKAKDDPKYCWRDNTGAVTRYSNAYIELIKKLTPEEVDSAMSAYKNRGFV